MLSAFGNSPKPLWVMPSIVAFSIGPMQFRTYPFMVCVGVIGMFLCVLMRRRRYCLSILQSILLTLFLAVCGLTGAKFLSILQNLPKSLENGISLAGGSFFGAVLLIPMLMPLLGKPLHLKPSTTMDICAPCGPIMVGCMRIACTLCGCCGGWVMYIGKIYFAWPTQIMECIGDIGLFFWLMHREKKGQKEGTLYPLFMLGYSGLRFIVEYFRYTPDTWLGISHGHWFTFIAALAGALWLKALSGNRTTGDQHEK